MQYCGRMKSYIGDTVRRLLELHSLEERLRVLGQDKVERVDAQSLIESLRSNLPVRVTICHDRFRAAGKRSVAEVRHGVCSACHMAVPIGVLADLKRDNGLDRCGSCGRYIYLVEEEESDRPLERRLVKRAASVNRA